MFFSSESKKKNQINLLMIAMFQCRNAHIFTLNKKKIQTQNLKLISKITDHFFLLINAPYKIQ